MYEKGKSALLCIDCGDYAALTDRMRHNNVKHHCRDYCRDYCRNHCGNYCRNNCWDDCRNNCWNNVR